MEFLNFLKISLDVFLFFLQISFHDLVTYFSQHNIKFYALFFIVIFLGFILGKKIKAMSSVSKVLSNLLLTVFLPILSITYIFTYVFTISNAVFDKVNLVLYFLLYLLPYGIFSFLYKDYKKDTREVLVLCVVFGSLKVTGQFSYSIFNALIYFYILIKIGGFKFDRQHWKQEIKHPIVITAFLSLLLLIFQAYIPANIMSQSGIFSRSLSVFQILSIAIDVIAWFIVGITLSSATIKDNLSSTAAWHGVLGRLVGTPLLAILLMAILVLTGFLSFPDFENTAFLDMVVSPTLALLVAYSVKYERQTLLISQSIFLTGVLSLLSIPFWFLIAEIVQWIYRF